ncbi:alkaline phosphatase family protein [Salinimonas sp. HHU 13199]|uniref:Alkaline phosphatase family protein n=1 Tax=Salinimonas profundi TaxID=2729140 RepID=A0ABR8LLI4_9ALTE|nr:ectonucleotide pyrophosphatase/phosphodiesterase [Salinimonas profundi]MBD3585936.1 alkaline phosphatase family protein [Salinimonas profundi]
MLRFLPVLCLIFLSSLATAKPANNQHVVLISVDGLRHDYIEKHQASELSRIAAQGVRAERMTPVYPANTFPNHLSLITGRYPVNHGIVNNRFTDKTRSDGKDFAKYSMGKGFKDSTWVNGTPLWNLAELNGVKAATYFWPESDARVNGRTPTYFYHYSKYADYQARIDQIIQWLRLPNNARPKFIAGYFSLVDSQGHKYGPNAQQTRLAVQEVDALLGQLFDRLQSFDFPVNLIIVSDHGMQSTDKDSRVQVDSLDIDTTLFEIVNQHTQLHIYAKENTSSQEITALKHRLDSQSDQRFTLLNQQLRKKYHYPVTARTGDILLQASSGTVFTEDKQSNVMPGSHGYWPDAQAMGATFVAVGPAFKSNVQLPVMSNLEVYPAIAHIMGLSLLGNIDGKMDVITQGLR